MVAGLKGRVRGRGSGAPSLGARGQPIWGQSQSTWTPLGCQCQEDLGAVAKAGSEGGSTTALVTLQSMQETNGQRKEILYGTQKYESCIKYPYIMCIYVQTFHLYGNISRYIMHASNWNWVQLLRTSHSKVQQWTTGHFMRRKIKMFSCKTKQR